VTVAAFNAQVAAGLDLAEDDVDVLLTEGYEPEAIARGLLQAAAIVLGHQYAVFELSDDVRRGELAELTLRFIDECDRHRLSCAHGALPPVLPEHLASRLQH
jgi:hypothetical protein